MRSKCSHKEPGPCGGVTCGTVRIHSRRVAMLVQSRSRTPEDTQKKLFTPVRIGPITLKHRVVMPPLSRLRAHKLTGVPTWVRCEFRLERASDGGVIITEARV